MYIFLMIVTDRCLLYLHAAANQTTDSTPSNTSEEADMPPPDSLPWPPAPASAAITPFLHIQEEDPGTRSPVVQALKYTDLASVQYPLPGSTIPLGSDTGPVTQAPALIPEAFNPMSGTLDHTIPSLGLASHAESSRAVPVVPEGSALDNGSTGTLSQYAEGTPIVNPAGSFFNQTGAPDNRAGSRVGRNARVAPVRLFRRLLSTRMRLRVLAARGLTPPFCHPLEGEHTAWMSLACPEMMLLRYGLLDR
jgi:hypothetical protein